MTEKAETNGRKAASTLSGLTAVCAIIAMALAPAPAIAQQFPVRSMRIFLPTAPGGPTDYFARAFGAGLQQRLGQPVVVENKPGAGGLVGLSALQNAPPDGHTLLLWSPTIATMSLFFKDAPNVVVGKDVLPVTPVCFYPHAWITPPGLSAKNLKDFVALVKANPGKFNVGYSAAGGPAVLNPMEFLNAAGLQMEGIAYNGTAAVMRAVMTNESQLHLASPFGLDALVKAGKIQVLAVTSLQRFHALPNVPTVKEAIGLDFQTSLQLGFFVPGETPKPIVDVLARELAVLANGSLREDIRSQGFEPLTMSPEDWTAYILADAKRSAEVARRVGIKPQ